MLLHPYALETGMTIGLALNAVKETDVTNLFL
jgi:hypothetical protein